MNPPVKAQYRYESYQKNPETSNKRNLPRYHRNAITPKTASNGSHRNRLPVSDVPLQVDKHQIDR